MVNDAFRLHAKKTYFSYVVFMQEITGYRIGAAYTRTGNLERGVRQMWNSVHLYQNK